MSNDKSRDLLKEFVRDLEEREYAAFKKAIGDRSIDFLIESVVVAGKDYVGPIADVITSHDLNKQFAKLISTLSCRAFHYGWIAKTEDFL